MARCQEAWDSELCPNWVIADIPYVVVRTYFQADINPRWARGVKGVALGQTIEDITPDNRMRVLIVESNPAAREGVRSALAEHYALLFASGQREALDLAREEAPDLIVTEVDLPDGDGLALCADIRRLPQTEKTPIMLLTSRAGVQDRVAGYNAGADDYVVKPFDARLFHARIRLLARIKGIQTRDS